MSPFLTILRRSLWLILLAAIGGSVYAWWRDRSTATAPEAPQWPPLDDASTTTAAVDAGGSAPADTANDTGSDRGDDAAGSEDDTGSNRGDDAVEESPSAAATDRPEPSVVNALVDAPDARSDGADQAWVEPDEDGSCPDGYPIKANDNSGIFHVPGGRFYDRTKAERCYASADGAIADGYRQAKS